MRKAGELCDRSLAAVIAAAKPGVLDSTLKGVYLTTILDGGADMPPNHPLFNSGPRAVYGRGVSAPRRIEAVDQILVEYPVAYRRYNVKTGMDHPLGRATDRQRHMYDAARDTLARMTAIARPGTTLGKSSTSMPTVSTGPASRRTATARQAIRSAAPSRRRAWTCPR